MNQLIKKMMRSLVKIYKQRPPLVFIVLAVIMVGVFFLVRSFASTPNAAVEPEKGTVTLPAFSVQDPNASGGSYLKFGSGVIDPLNPGETWGDHMGISGEINRINIDHTAELGIKWLKFSHEYDWGPFDTSFITYAHSKGIKVIESCQKTPHEYSLADIPSFTDWCGNWAFSGVDAIEIGNEWNHADPFWQKNPVGDYSVQAKIHDATIKRIRALSPTMPIITVGWSSEDSPNLPNEAMGKMLAKSDGTIKNQASYIGHHPYAYNCSSVLDCGYPNNVHDSNFLASQDVYAAAAFSGLKKPMAFTEIGAPSGNGSIKRLGDGVVFSKTTQYITYKEYLAGIALMRAKGTPIGLILWSTIKDGEAATNILEQSLGIYDSNYAIKPAGLLVACQASKPWDNSGTNCW